MLLGLISGVCTVCILCTVCAVCTLCAVYTVYTVCAVCTVRVCTICTACTLCLSWNKRTSFRPLFLDTLMFSDPTNPLTQKATKLCAAKLQAK
jgi:hypothetical protein